MGMNMKRQHKWQDPTMISENKLPARNLALPFGEHDAYSTDTSPYKLTLNGQWRFLWQQGLDQDLPVTRYSRPDYDDSAWDNTPVPSVWQLQGYGKPFYLCSWVHDKYVSTSKRKIPTVYPEANEAGVYRRTFTLPPHWNGRRVVLHFGAAKSALEVYVNGQYVGWSQGSMTPAEFDVTEFLQPGENHVTAIVYRISTAFYLENQDMWNFSGIYREVYLVAEPAVSIYDMFADTGLTNDFATGTLKAEITLYNSMAQQKQVQVSLWVNDECYAEQTVLVDPHDYNIIPFARQEFPGLAHWSAEQPNLHTFQVLVHDEHGQFISKKRIRIGFRRIDIHGNVLKFNGRRVVIKGVNRHDFDPDHGWHVPRERTYEDLYLAKRANVNAIRCAHYPDDPFFYQLCDELGFYVMDEADLESHGVRRKNCPGNHPQWRAAVIDRAERMVLRDRSHACVCFWSLGNEAGDGLNFLYEREAILQLDKSRPIHYEGDFDYTKSDFISRMYPLQGIVKLMREQKAYKPEWFMAIANKLAADNKAIPQSVYATHPVMYCEYAHAMHNSLGNFREYVQDFEDYPHMCGGFIWDYIDQTIRASEVMQTQHPPGTWIYGGDFDEGRSSYYFCNNGILSADRKPHPSYDEVRQVYANVSAVHFHAGAQRVTLRNKSLFTPMSAYEVHWQLSNNGHVAQQGILDEIDIAPGQDLQVHVPFDLSQISARGELLLTVTFKLRNTQPWAAAGYVLRHDQFVLNPWQPPALLVNNESLDCKRKRGQWLLQSDKIKIAFKRGRLSSLDFGQGELIAQGKKLGLQPNVFRALTDNDTGYINFAPWLSRFHPLRLWKASQRGLFALSSRVRRINDSQVRVTVRWASPLHFAGLHTTYDIHASGQIEVQHRVRGLCLPMLRVGMKLGIAPELARVKWYGRGSNEAYCDRKTGQQIALHDMPVEQLTHHYTRPQENGNREDVRCLRLVDDNGCGLRVDAETTVNFSASCYSPNKLDKAKHIHELEPDAHITLCVDGFSRGVGGDLPGNALLHEPYKLKPRKYAYKFTITKA